MEVTRKIKKDEISKYLLTDVSSCTFTFSDGTKSKIAVSPKNEIVLLKLIPSKFSSKLFENMVLKNYQSAKNAKELAILCKYNNLRTFTRHFKKYFKETPYQWMLHRKMDEIQSLVQHTNISITEIARKYDFKNVTHLVSAYTKRFGISPQKERLSSIPVIKNGINKI